jgi:hypothetical protein
VFKVSLPPYFAEMWVYSTCTNVISHCDELALGLSSNTSSTIASSSPNQTNFQSDDQQQQHQATTTASSTMTAEQQELRIYEENKADLLTLARTQLDILGIAANMVPVPSMHVPRSVLAKLEIQAASNIQMGGEDGSSGVGGSVFKDIPNDSLRMALNDRDAYDSLYLVNQ